MNETRVIYGNKVKKVTPHWIRNRLHKVTSVWGNMDGDQMLVHLHLDDGRTFSFTDEPSAAWDWLHRPGLYNVHLVWRQQLYTITPGKKGRMP